MVVMVGQTRGSRDEHTDSFSNRVGGTMIKHRVSGMCKVFFLSLSQAGVPDHKNAVISLDRNDSPLA